MRKRLSILLAVLMLLAVFTGCSSVVDATDAQTVAESSGESLAQTVSGATASDFYSAYADAKSVLLSNLVDALGTNADTAMASLSFLGISFAELYMLPANYFGLGESAVTNALAVLGSRNVNYTEDGNTYTATYLDSDDQPCEFTGTFDPAGSLICTGSTNGMEYVLAESYQTPFGYVGQFYLVDDDGSTTLYQFTVDGTDGNGIIGITFDAERPSALTGNESPDFPTGCAEWYSIYGTNVTGVTSDGTYVEFEYVPTDDAE